MVYNHPMSVSIEFWHGVSCLEKWVDAAVVPSVGHKVRVGNPPISVMVTDVFWRSSTDVHVFVVLSPLTLHVPQPTPPEGSNDQEA